MYICYLCTEKATRIIHGKEVSIPVCDNHASEVLADVYFSFLDEEAMKLFKTKYNGVNR